MVWTTSRHRQSSRCLWDVWLAWKREKLKAETDELHEKIAEYNAILADEKRVRAIVKQELLEIKEKFNDPRRTEIASVEGERWTSNLIPQEECVVTLTHFGYLKRQPLDVYKTQRRGRRGISGMTRRDEDFVSDIYTCSTHDYLMFFTNKGKVYRIKGYEIPEGSVPPAAPMWSTSCRWNRVRRLPA